MKPLTCPNIIANKTTLKVDSLSASLQTSMLPPFISAGFPLTVSLDPLSLGSGISFLPSNHPPN
jgi:hypothetical protein